MLLSELKQQTYEQHQRLELELDITSKLGDLDLYRQLLVGFYGWWKPWESTVAASNQSEIVNFLLPRRKVPLLEADLGYLGFSKREIDNVPTANVPGLKTAPQLLGSLYVAEGSTLGGQIITRMIEERLNLRDGNGYSFYESYGPRVGSMWREFGNFFESHVPPNELQHAVDSAKDTFEGIRKWLGERR